MSQDLYRKLPKVDALLAAPRLAGLPRAAALRAAREVLDELREGIREGAVSEIGDVEGLVLRRAEAQRARRLRRVINATGVVLHTNLGRAPLHPEAAAAVAEVAAGYSNTELELSTGKRGGRLRGVQEPLLALLGCEDAIAVNNCAAAVYLVLAALGKGKECIVSRGELVEIGGSFRMPDVMAESGCTLREVGTTNRTRAADYAAAIGPETAMMMRVHRSNFRIVGFTERPTTAELAALPAILVEDLGGGDLRGEIPGEAPVRQVLEDGADLVCFSGDKLLGGPQAGIIVGRAELVRACRRHPLYRALRLDKLALAGLEATLRVHLEGRPVRALAMLADPGDAAALAARLAPIADRAGVALALEDDVTYSGGGALPGRELPARVLALRGLSPERLAGYLRECDPPVVARVARDALILDPRTVLPGEEEALASALETALNRAGTPGGA
jgi:L-seryl-tRNA(Ser) seleniumtransferase